MAALATAKAGQLVLGSGAMSEPDSASNMQPAIAQPAIPPIPVSGAGLDFGGGDMFSGLHLAEQESAESQLPQPAHDTAPAVSNQSAAHGVAG